MERPAIKLGKLISIEYYMPVGMLSAIGGRLVVGIGGVVV